MKKIALIILSILTMTMANGQTLTERQKGLAACACLMAQGDLDRLQPAVRTDLDNGVTINELKEAFSQPTNREPLIWATASLWWMNFPPGSMPRLIRSATTGTSIMDRCRC